MTRLETFQKWVGLDSAIFFTIVGRAVQFGSGFLSLMMIVHFLSPEEQGFYYTFNSILGLQILLELGFGGVLMQFISHEWAHLSLSPQMEIVGNAFHRDRFISLIRFGTRWFFIVSILFFLFCSILGGMFFHLKPHAGINWEGPWVGVVFAFSLFIFLSPYLSILEGCQKISEVAFVRLLGIIFNCCFGWISLGLGLKLYFPMFAFLGYVFIYSLALIWKFPFLLKLSWGEITPIQNPISWKNEIWPMQSRIAISFGLGFILFNFYSPVLFYFRGSIEAGRMGMSMAIINGISAIGMAWVGTKAPIFGRQIAKGETKELKSLFLKSFKQSYVVVIFTSLLCFVGIQFISQVFPAFGNRILSSPALVALFLYAITNHLVNCQAIFLRAFKEEPFLILTVIGSFCIGICDVVFGILFGGLGISVAYFAVSFILLPLPTWIWWKKWREL
ncbi:MAG: hypothetical protein ACD_56C00156G0005 [uncultured bacterium]|nr:MAG: hypothetical protein ACD_56C00156G0005 [uncultured bacterium]